MEPTEHGDCVDAASKLPLGGDELLSKKRVLRNQLYASANEIHGQPQYKPKKVG